MYDGTVGLCEKGGGFGLSDGKDGDGGVINGPLGLS